jgi:hypothetical protein
VDTEAALILWTIFGGWLGLSIADEGWSRLNVVGKATAVILALPAILIAAGAVAAAVAIITLVQLVFLRNPDYLIMEVWNGYQNKDSKTTEGGQTD